MYRKILLLLLIFFLSSLSACSFANPDFNPFPHTHKKGNHESYVFYDENGRRIGEECFEEGVTHIRFSDIENFNYKMPDDAEKLDDIFELMKYEYKIDYIPYEIGLPYPASNTYEYVIEDGLDSTYRFSAIFSYDFVELTDKKIENLEFFEVEYTPHENPGDTYDEFRLDSYITYMDINNVFDYIQISYFTSSTGEYFTSIKFKVCIEIEENRYFSSYDVKKKRDFYEKTEDDKNEILVVNANYILSTTLNNETIKTAMVQFFGYRCSVFIPDYYVKASSETDYRVGLISFHNKKIKILKNDILE